MTAGALAVNEAKVRMFNTLTELLRALVKLAETGQAMLDDERAMAAKRRGQ